MRRSLVLAAVVMAALPVLAHAELVDNPVYQYWAKYKAGTFTTFKMEMEIPGVPAGMAGKGTTITNKLAEISPEKAVVEITLAIDAPGVPARAHKQEIPAKIEKDKLDAAEFQAQNPQAKDVKITDVKVGKDKIDVKGETLEVITREATMETTQQGQTIVAKIKTWTTDKIPGGMVKMVANTEKPMPMKNTTTLSDYHLEK